MSTPDTENFNSRIRGMTDKELAEALINKDDWQLDFYNLAKAEANRRQLNVADPSKEHPVTTVDDFNVIIRNTVASRKPIPQLIEHLVSLGQPIDTASKHVKTIGSEVVSKEINRLELERNFRLLICIGGVVVTAVTFLAALNGGTYVLAWGAIIFGGMKAGLANSEIEKLKTYLEGFTSA